MIRKEIIHKITGEKIVGFENRDFEYVNPVKYYEEDFIVQQMVLNGIPDEEIFGDVEPSEKSKQIFLEAVSNSKKYMQKFKTTRVSENFTKLFGTNKKATQETFLKGSILTPEILMSLLMKASEIGYTMSEYSGEHFPENVDLSKMPLVYRVKQNGEVQIFGETELTEGQLKQALEHRKVTIAKFLDRNDEWHCFFVTFHSLRGKETWLGEKQPHYHYISNAFGLNREKVVKQIKSKIYKLGNLPHIKLEGYGSQPKKSSH